MSEGISQEIIPAIRNDTRNSDGTYKPGVSGNPSGRPRGTLKDYVRRKFMEMSDEEKELWMIENKIPALDQWKMSEGNPKNDVEVTGNLSISQVLDELDGQEIKRQDVEIKPPLQDPEQIGEARTISVEPSAETLLRQQMDTELDSQE